MAKTSVKGVKGKPEVFHACYDFSVDAGAIGTVDLFSLAANTIIHDGWYEVETAASTANSPTIEVGYSGNTAVIFAQQASSVYAEDYVSDDQGLGTDLFDDSNDHHIRKKVTSATTIQMKIATGALTAGKFHFYLICSDGY